MRRFRWLLLQVATAALLLGALFGTVSSPAWAAKSGQTQPTTNGRAGLPVPGVPANNGVIRANVSPPPFTVTTIEVSPSPTESIPSADPAPITAAVAMSTPAAITTTGALTTLTEISSTSEISATTVPTYYVVQSGDTLFVIATDHGTTVEAVMEANGMNNPDILNVGQVLIIPGADGTLLDPALLPVVTVDGELTQTVIAPRGTITERMTSLAQQADVKSPYYKTTWLTYYGRPNIDVMGILGEYSIDDLIPLLRAEADAYEKANGDALNVVPAFHLVYGMATKATMDDNSHLAYMEESEVISYIEAAEAQGWGVILDVQIGALEPTESISPALEYLKYPNVHLAIDPEFAMSHAGQAWPGDPIGFITAEQVNAVQALIDNYLATEKLPSPRILLVHQFQDTMIVDKEKLDQSSYPNVALTLSVDGWGGPWGKISKYNSLVTKESPYVAFKLFYRWDEPLLLPDEALGNRPYRGSDFFMDVTPNLIIYQ